MAKGTEIEPAANQVAEIMGDVVPEIEDSENTQRQIVEQIVNASTLDELFQVQKTVATRDMVDIPITVENCRLMEGEIEGKKTVFMVIDVENLETKEKLALNSGAPNIMAILYRAKKLGLLPMQVRVAEAGTARKGRNAPLTLKPIGETLRSIEASQSA
jgi:hypothetical protein